jgi:hypothetical protein
MTGKFPVDAPRATVPAVLQALGLRVVRQGGQIAMVRENADGSPDNGFARRDGLHGVR